MRKVTNSEAKLNVFYATNIWLFLCSNSNYLALNNIWLALDFETGTYFNDNPFTMIRFIGFLMRMIKGKSKVETELVNKFHAMNATS